LRHSLAFGRPAMTVKDDKLTVLEKKDFCEYKEEQIANGNKFSFPAVEYTFQLPSCGVHL
jgi:hypothetical protein